MPFFFLCVFTFLIFFQPGVVFPELISYRPVLVSSVVALLAYMIFGKRNETAFLSHNYTRFFILFIFMQVLSSTKIWITGGMETFLFWIIFLIIFYLMVKECTNSKHFKYILIMMITPIIYLSYFSLKDVYLNHEPGYRAIGFGWYENANDLSLILITLIPLLFYFAETSKSFLVKILFVGISIMFSVNILFTGSRQALLGLFVVGSLCLFFSKRISRIFRLLISVLMIVSVMTVGIATVMARGDLGGQILGDTSSENRLVQWKACIIMALKNPILGVGPGESAFVMRKYGGVQGLVPHNTLLQVFAETGIPGGVFFFLCTCYPMWVAMKTLKKRRERLNNQALAIYKYLTIALLGFWACAIFSNRVQFAILYILIALMVAFEENILKREITYITS